MKALVPLSLAAGSLLASGTAMAERRDHDAHVHGSAAMDVAALGGEIEIVLRSPAMNIVGFEHEPRTDAQREKLREAMAVLGHGATLFAFGDTVCRLRDVGVDHEDAGPGQEDEHGHGKQADESRHQHEGHSTESGHGDAERGHDHDEDDHEHGDDHGEAAHSEMRVHYHFDCEQSVEIVEVGLFERFPGTNELRVQYLTDESQGAQTLTPDAATLYLE